MTTIRSNGFTGLSYRKGLSPTLLVSKQMREEMREATLRITPHHVYAHLIKTKLKEGPLKFRHECMECSQHQCDVCTPKTSAHSASHGAISTKKQRNPSFLLRMVYRAYELSCNLVLCSPNSRLTSVPTTDGVAWATPKAARNSSMLW